MAFESLRSFMNGFLRLTNRAETPTSRRPFTFICFGFPRARTFAYPRITRILSLSRLLTRHATDVGPIENTLEGIFEVPPRHRHSLRIPHSQTGRARSMRFRARCTGPGAFIGDRFRIQSRCNSGNAIFDTRCCGTFYAGERVDHLGDSGVYGQSRIWRLQPTTIPATGGGGAGVPRGAGHRAFPSHGKRVW